MIFKLTKSSIFCDCYNHDDSIKKKIKIQLLFWFVPFLTTIKLYPLIRLSQKLYHLGYIRFARFIQYKIFNDFSCIISFKALIGNKINFPHPVSIVIGEKCVIGHNVTIYQNVTLGQKDNEYPRIGNNVIIYAGAKIVGGIVIGHNSIVGTNAVVINSVPDDSIVAGVPAKIIGFNERSIKR